MTASSTTLPRRHFIGTTLALAGGLLATRRATAAETGAAAAPAQASGPTVLHGVSPRLTIHLLDTYHGMAAAGLKVDFSRLENSRPVPLQSLVIDARGRAESPLLIDETYRAGDYELLLHVGEYFQSKKAPLPEPPFLTEVPIRFTIPDEKERLHLPIQFGPWSYTYSRGS